MGLVADVFNEPTLKALSGDSAVGHVRYSTTGSSLLKNAQPFLAQHHGSFMAIAHNGNLVNALELKDKLEAQGSIFQSTMDSEIFVHLIARSKKSGLPGEDHSGPLASPGSLFHRHSDGKWPDRSQGPPWFPASLPGEDRWKFCLGFGDLCPGFGPGRIYQGCSPRRGGLDR